MIIGVDFDGTICKHAGFPAIGEPVPGALEALKVLISDGHRIVLWTVRSGGPLMLAEKYLRENGIDLHGVNENPNQYAWSQSPKAYCHLFVDDASVGCPLMYGAEGERPFVDWYRVMERIRNMMFEPKRHRGLVKVAVLPIVASSWPTSDFWPFAFDAAGLVVFDLGIIYESAETP